MSSWVLCRVALVKSDVSVDLSACIIRMTICELGTSAVTSNRRTLRRNTLPEETAEEIRQVTVRILKGSRQPKDFTLYFFVACVGC
jgi:hypothetical protein